MNKWNKRKALRNGSLSLPGVSLLLLCLSSPILPVPVPGTETNSLKSSRNSIIFGGSRNYAPFEWLRPDNSARGFLIDLEDAMARADGLEPVHRQKEWNLVLSDLRGGQIDIVPMFHSEKRERFFDFSPPIYYLTHGIFTRENGPIASRPGELQGHTVAVVEDGYAADRLSERYPKVKLHKVTDIHDALEALIRKEADFAVLSRPVARRFIEEEELAVDEVSPPFWPRAYVFAVRKGNVEMYNWLLHRLALLKASGEYHRIYGEWEDQLEWSKPTISDFVQRYSWAVLVVLALLISGMIWSYTLRKEVARRTSELQSELKMRRAAEERAAYRASHDLLTGLPNRIQFLEDLEGASLPKDQSITILAIKLRGIEEIILTFGYESGEALLCSFANRLQNTENIALSHLGRGEFILARKSSPTATGILNAINRPLELDEMEIDPGLAIGFSTEPANAVPAMELLRRARTALSAAIERRRPWQEYSPSIEPDREAISLLRDFWQTGTRDFTAFFQPQIDIQKNEIAGAEALVRWQHPQLGLLSPGSFIPILERTGAIHHITGLMLDRGVEFASRSRKEGYPCHVSVNVGTSDLLEHDVVSQVEEALSRYDGRPEDLSLEMTETGLISEPGHVSIVLHRLHEMNVNCSIDDFGTGYSSLSYLSEFPVTGIKIDREFVGGMLSDGRKRAIVESSVNLAHAMELNVVAEGPEDTSTVKALIDMGCDLAQGFVYSPPLPASEFKQYYRSFGLK
tara:strand:- start:31412 stop:33646 length:2235 start_codon:yes stop_codon:yes gene_type:complete